MSRFDIISGVEGYCLALDERRIAGPKPWGGGMVVATFTTKGNYEPQRTCKLVDYQSGPDMYCTACMGRVDDEYRYFMSSHGYSRCPHCGARIEVSE